MFLFVPIPPLTGSRLNRCQRVNRKVLFCKTLAWNWKRPFALLFCSSGVCRSTSLTSEKRCAPAWGAWNAIDNLYLPFCMVILLFVLHLSDTLGMNNLTRRPQSSTVFSLPFFHLSLGLMEMTQATLDAKLCFSQDCIRKKEAEVQTHDQSSQETSPHIEL